MTDLVLLSGWRNVVDLLVLTTAIYLVLRWSRAARALRLAFGILALEAAAIASARAGLPVTSWVLHASALLGGLSVIVLFQPELRHALGRLEIRLRWNRGRVVLLDTLDAVTQAAFSLAIARRGALIVVARRDPVTELVEGGVPLGGRVSPPILEAVFRKVSPVHDGATIVEGEQIVRVGAILPLAASEHLPPAWGTRHRAGMGLAERCDALVVVASEERGQVTLMHDARFEPMSTPTELRGRLQSLMAPSPPSSRARLFTRRDLGLSAVATALALVIWASVLGTGSAVRVRTAPIEFTNLSPGLRLAGQSTTSVDVRLRGPTWLLDSIDEGATVAHVSLLGVGEGTHWLLLAPRAFQLPPGVSVDEVSPPRVQVRLTGEHRP